MKLTIESPDTGVRTYDLGSSSFRTIFIGDQLKMLMKCLREKTSKQEKELRYDIGVYLYMLGSKDPDSLIKKYGDTKDKLKTYSKRAVAEHLKWTIEPYKGEGTVQ